MVFRSFVSFSTAVSLDLSYKIDQLRLLSRALTKCPLNVSQTFDKFFKFIKHLKETERYFLKIFLLTEYKGSMTLSIQPICILGNS